MPPFPSLTKEWHSKSYPSIDPTRKELSAKGKVVAITGGGGAIGGAVAIAFAQAGAQKIALLGRRDGPLQESKAAIEKAVPGTEVHVVHGDVSEADSMYGALGNVKNDLGPIDIFVANAGYLPTFEPLEKADPEEWWKGFEINVKGAFNVTRAFHSNAADHAILVEVSTGPVHMPAMAKASGYIASKMAATKVYETFAAENENYEVIHIHPGVIKSEINLKSGISAIDDADLPGNFIVWACSPEAKDFRRTGDKFLWVNWDVDELKERKEELTKPHQLTITMNGWPFGEGGDDSKGSLNF